MGRPHSPTGPVQRKQLQDARESALQAQLKVIRALRIPIVDIEDWIALSGELLELLHGIQVSIQQAEGIIEKWNRKYNEKESES